MPVTFVLEISSFRILRGYCIFLSSFFPFICHGYNWVSPPFCHLDFGLKSFPGLRSKETWPASPPTIQLGFFLAVPFFQPMSPFLKVLDVIFCWHILSFFIFFVLSPLTWDHFHPFRMSTHLRVIFRWFLALMVNTVLIYLFRPRFSFPFCDRLLSPEP